MANKGPLNRQKDETNPVETAFIGMLVGTGAGIVPSVIMHSTLPVFAGAAVGFLIGGATGPANRPISPVRNKEREISMAESNDPVGTRKRRGYGYQS